MGEIMIVYCACAIVSNHSGVITVKVSKFICCEILSFYPTDMFVGMKIA